MNKIQNRQQILLLALFLTTTCTLYGQVASSITVLDTRSGDSLPSHYKRFANFEFKYRTVINSPGTGTYVGLMTLAPWMDASGGPVYQLSFAQDGLFIRTGTFPSTWNGWNRVLTENYTGITTLGNGSAGSGLNVNGIIKTREVNVTTTGWPDYVFKPGYHLLSLDSLSRQIKNEQHLPGMPSAIEIEKSGLNLAATNRLQQQKIEELTLYLIEEADKNKKSADRIQQLEEQNRQQQTILVSLEQRVSALEKAGNTHQLTTKK